jgi:hypothetical protein
MAIRINIVIRYFIFKIFFYVYKTNATNPFPSVKLSGRLKKHRFTQVFLQVANNKSDIIFFLSSMTVAYL